MNIKRAMLVACALGLLGAPVHAGEHLQAYINDITTGAAKIFDRVQGLRMGALIESGMRPRDVEDLLGSPSDASCQIFSGEVRQSYYYPRYGLQIVFVSGRVVYRRFEGLLPPAEY